MGQALSNTQKLHGAIRKKNMVKKSISPQNGSIPGIQWGPSPISAYFPMAESMLDKFATSPRSRSLRVHCEPKLLVNQPPCHDHSADSIVIDWASNPVCYRCECEYIVPVADGFFNVF